MKTMILAFICIMLISFCTCESYVPTNETLVGSLKVLGSSTIEHIMKLWISNFTAIYKNVNITSISTGSSAAPDALISGESQIAPMSRSMKASEKQRFFDRFNYSVTELVVGLDALNVIVNEVNPVKYIFLDDIKRVYSDSSCKDPPLQPIYEWSDLISQEPIANMTIVTYGRDNSSGTYSFFKEKAVCGNYKDSMIHLESSEEIIEAVRGAINSMGYTDNSVMSIKHPGIRSLAVSPHRDVRLFIEPTEENIRMKQYPLSRELFLYINKEPSKLIPKLLREFLLFTMSDQGQDSVQESGFVKIHRFTRDVQVVNLGLDLGNFEFLFEDSLVAAKEQVSYILLIVSLLVLH